MVCNKRDLISKHLGESICSGLMLDMTKIMTIQQRHKVLLCYYIFPILFM